MTFEKPEDCLLTRPQTIAMVGLGPSFNQFCAAQMSSQRNFPEFDEVWTLNAGVTWCLSDKIFDMHDLRDVERSAPRMGRFMRDTQTPIITLEKYKEYPTSVAFPKDEVIKAVQFDFFSCTPAWMMGYAMLIGSVKDIWFFGMDFMYPKVEMREEGGQSMAFLMGIAYARGIAPHIPNTSTLLGANKCQFIDGEPRRPLYGYVKGAWATADTPYDYGKDNPTIAKTSPMVKPDGDARDDAGTSEGTRVQTDEGQRQRSDDSPTGQDESLRSPVAGR